MLAHVISMFVKVVFVLLFIFMFTGTHEIIIIHRSSITDNRLRKVCLDINIERLEWSFLA